MSEKTIPWTATDKTVLAIFIFECVLLVISLFGWFIMGDVMFYPAFMGGVKTITLGINLFGMRQS